MNYRSSFGTTLGYYYAYPSITVDKKSIILELEIIEQNNWMLKLWARLNDKTKSELSKGNNQL
jgi:hypothetical protein